MGSKDGRAAGSHASSKKVRDISENCCWRNRKPRRPRPVATRTSPLPPNHHRPHRSGPPHCLCCHICTAASLSTTAPLPAAALMLLQRCRSKGVVLVVRARVLWQQYSYAGLTVGQEEEGDSWFCFLREIASLEVPALPQRHRENLGHAPSLDKFNYCSICKCL